MTPPAYEVRKAQAAPGVDHPTHWIIVRGPWMPLGGWMFTREEADAIADALNAACAAGAGALSPAEVSALADAAEALVLYLGDNHNEPLPPFSSADDQHRAAAQLAGLLGRANLSGGA